MTIQISVVKTETGRSPHSGARGKLDMSDSFANARALFRKCVDVYMASMRARKQVIVWSHGVDPHELESGDAYVLATFKGHTPGATGSPREMGQSNPWQIEAVAARSDPKGGKDSPS